MQYKNSLCVAILLSIFPSTAYQQELGLKMQQELLPPREADEKSPLFVDADRIRGRQEREIEATGNVHLRRAGEAVFADYLHYDFVEQEVVARGNLRFERDGVVVTGQGLRYNLADSIGEMEQAEYFVLDPKARGTARRLSSEARSKVHIEDATYTTCDVGDDDWYLRARKIDLDRTRDLGVARDASVVFKGVPILYSPYLDFSLSGNRKSGLLPPSVGQTAQSGFEVTTPYYFNLAPNYDATIFPRYMSRRGLQLGGELRYLQPSLNGEVQLQYMYDDKLREEERYAYALRHNQRFGANTTGYVNLLGVSDDFYFTDLSNQIAATSLTNLPREVGVSYDGSWWNLSARVQEFQTLQDATVPITPPYARLPQISLLATRPTPLGLDVNVFGELVNFQHPTLVSARRDILYPSLILPLRTSYFYFTPKVGYHYTHYSYDGDIPPPQTRQLPIYSVDSAITYERETTFFGSNFTQTLEPRLYYVYIPFVEQDQLPVFDTSQADFNLTQIFSENQFTGGDRINNADQLTAAVSSRLLDPVTGVERIRVTLAQRYYFAPQLVTLPDQEPRSDDRSDVLLGAEGKLGAAWTFNMLMQYGATDDQIEMSHHALQYRPEPGKVLNMAYRYRRGEQEQVDFSTQWPLSAQWSGLARWNYSLAADKVLEGLAGLEYNAGCWTTRLVAHHFVNSADDYSTSFFVQLELSGVSRIGLNPLETLRRNISGYVDLEE